MVLVGVWCYNSASERRSALQDREVFIRLGRYLFEPQAYTPGLFQLSSTCLYAQSLEPSVNGKGNLLVCAASIARSALVSKELPRHGLPESSSPDTRL